jgi:hypothetical protein
MLLRNTKLQCRAHEISSVEPTLSLFYPYYTPTHYFPNIIRSIGSLLTARSPILINFPDLSLVFMFQFPHACLMSRPCHSPWFAHFNDIKWRLCVSSFCNILSPPATPSFFFLSILFSDTRNLGFSFMGLFGTSATNWPIIPAPDDRWWWMWNSRWNENCQGKPKYS